MNIVACNFIKTINFYWSRQWLRYEHYDAEVNIFHLNLVWVLTVQKWRHIRAIIRYWITGIPSGTPHRRRFAVFQSNWICRVNSTRHLSRDISHGHAIYRVRTGTTANPQRFMPFNKSLVTEKCRATNVRSESTSRNAPYRDVRYSSESRIAVLERKTWTSLHFIQRTCAWRKAEQSLRVLQNETKK